MLAFGPRFYIWQLVYAGQFFALEFFFRGVLLHGLAARIGPVAVFIALIPYVMIHLTKPLAETLGSILAGLVLGFLSLRTRSVYLGAALHFGVAANHGSFGVSKNVGSIELGITGVDIIASDAAQR